MDLDGDAAAGSGHPSEVVEVAAEVGDQGAGLPHGFAFQVGLRAQVRKAFLRRDRRCRRSHSLSQKGFVLPTKEITKLRPHGHGSAGNRNQIRGPTPIAERAPCFTCNEWLGVSGCTDGIS